METIELGRVKTAVRMLNEGISILHFSVRPAVPKLGGAPPASGPALKQVRCSKAK